MPDQTMCWDHHCAEGEKCCHAMMDLGVSYCCTEYSGYVGVGGMDKFVFLGLVLGGGLTIALLIVVCYLCMRKAERRLEEEAKLEALKTLSGTAVARSSENGCTSASPSTFSTASLYNLDLPPPAYEQVIAPDYLLNNPNHIRRCQSCEPHQGGTPRVGYLDMNAIVARSLSENIGGRYRNTDSSSPNEIPPQAKYYNLPPLPPVLGSSDKLPTYNECTGSHMSQNAHSSETGQRASSETPSNGVATRNTEPVEARDGRRKTSSLHRPIYIPIALQQANTMNNGLQSPLRLSTPTQVDDGTGIIIAMQTGVPRAPADENRDQISPPEVANLHQNTSIPIKDRGQSLRTDVTASQQADVEEEEGKESTSTSSALALLNPREEEISEASTSSISEPVGSDEMTLIHDGYVPSTSIDRKVNGEGKTKTNKESELEKITEEEEGSPTDGSCTGNV